MLPIKKVLALVFFLITSSLFCLAQNLNDSCSFWFEKEWEREVEFDSSNNHQYTFFTHNLPDSSNLPYVDFDYNGVRYLDSVYLWIDRYHYNPYKNISSQEFRELYDSIRNVILVDSTLNPKTHYVLLRRLVTSIKDGHTELDFRGYNHYIEQGGIFLPFNISIEKNNIFVSEILQEGSLLSEGDQILEIEGLSDSFLLKKFELLVIKDPSGCLAKQESISANFDFLLWLCLNESSPCYSIKIRKSLSNDTLCFRIKGMTQNDIHEGIDTDYEENIYFALHPEKSVALLNLPTLKIDRKKRLFKKRIRKAFKLIQQKSIDTLLIDIRGNLGGTCDHFLHLMKYFVPRDSIMEVSIKMKSWDPKEVNRKGEFYLYRHYKERGFRQKRKFKGDVILITDNQTYSVAGLFADFFKAYNVGTTIGYSHGNINGFGSPIRFTWDFSYTDLYIPRAKFITSEWVKIGASPDRVIEPSEYLEVLREEWYLEWVF